MKISNTYVSNNINLSKVDKNFFIHNFHKKYNFAEQGRNNIGRIIHPAGVMMALATAFFDTGLDKPIHTIGLLTLAYMQCGLDKMFHNIALRKSQLLVRYLKSNGIDDTKELSNIIDVYLKKYGGLFYSNYVRVFQKDKIEAVAKGENAAQIKGLMTYLRDKYTLLTPQITNKAQAIKRKNSINKLFAKNR